MPSKTTGFALYLAAVVAAGLGCLAWVVATETPAPAGQPALLWVLVACVVLAELLPSGVVPRGRDGVLVTAAAFAFATLIAYGPGVAVPALVLAGLTADVVRRTPWRRTLFDVGHHALALTATAVVVELLTDVPRSGPPAFGGADVPLLLLCGAGFLALEIVFVSVAVALATRSPVRCTVRSDLLARAATAGLALGLTPLMVIVGEFSVGLLPLLAIPLFAIHRNTRQAVISEHQALHDALTGLPNRLLFHDRVRQAIESARRHGGTSALMVMDLDHFKEINDTLGHYHGDRLLQLVGERLSTLLRSEDTVARMGGDEFAILLPSVRDPSYALEVARKVLDELRRPVEIDGLALEVGASVGIACFPQHGDDGETLLQRADIAMYVAKGGHAGAQLYEAEQDRHSVQRLALAGELRRAIERDELVLHYQPKVELGTGRIVGAEALCRWEHPSLGLVMPDEFVPMAEHTGLITPMTKQVLTIALQQVSRWRAQGRRLPVAINLSARSLLDSQLLDDIPELLAVWRVSPALLGLEITESMIVGDPGRARDVLGRLHQLGMTLAIDDFGTGYSSLAYLRQLPVDEIKIDRSFVMQMGGNQSDETIVRSIIDLAHNLGLRAVAEGVEDQVIMDRLLELGCDVAQGYHLARPLPPDRLEQWVDAYPLRATWLPEGPGAAHAA